MKQSKQKCLTILILMGSLFSLGLGGFGGAQVKEKPQQQQLPADAMAGLYRLKNTVLQSLFFSGGRQNIDDALVDDWINAVHYIQPRSVQIYTLDRPPREENLRPVPLETLNRISIRLTAKTGITGEVFG